MCYLLDSSTLWGTKDVSENLIQLWEQCGILSSWFTDCYSLLPQNTFRNTIRYCNLVFVFYLIGAWTLLEFPPKQLMSQSNSFQSMISGYQKSVVGDKHLCLVHQNSHFETGGSLFRSLENVQPQGTLLWLEKGECLMTLDEGLQKSSRN